MSAPSSSSSAVWPRRKRQRVGVQLPDVAALAAGGRSRGRPAAGSAAGGDVPEPGGELGDLGAAPMTSRIAPRWSGRADQRVAAALAPRTARVGAVPGAVSAEVVAQASPPPRPGRSRCRRRVAPGGERRSAAAASASRTSPRARPRKRSARNGPPERRAFGQVCGVGGDALARAAARPARRSWSNQAWMSAISRARSGGLLAARWWPKSPSSSDSGHVGVSRAVRLGKRVASSTGKRSSVEPRGDEQRRGGVAGLDVDRRSGSARAGRRSSRRVRVGRRARRQSVRATQPATSASGSVPGGAR